MIKTASSKKVSDLLNHILRFFTSNSKLLLGFSIILTLCIIASLEPIINYTRLRGCDPLETGIYPSLLRESFEHPLGTDRLGRDILALVITGLKYTLVIGFFTGSLTALISIIIALFAGYKGGVCDSILTFLTNVFLVIPLWPILVSIAALAKVNLTLMCLVIAIFSWPWPARTIRAQVLILKEREYILLAKVSGLSDIEIIFEEILPNLLPYIGVSVANSIVGAMLAETGVRVVGFGPTNIPTLGLIIFWTMQWGFIGSGRYLAVIIPILLLILVFSSLQLINIGLEETYNPRLKKITGL
jgi:peptide/nickel transport system permease protein